MNILIQTRNTGRGLAVGVALATRTWAAKAAPTKSRIVVLLFLMAQSDNSQLVPYAVL